MTTQVEHLKWSAVSQLHALMHLQAHAASPGVELGLVDPEALQLALAVRGIDLVSALTSLMGIDELSTDVEFESARRVIDGPQVRVINGPPLVS